MGGGRYFEPRIGRSRRFLRVSFRTDTGDILSPIVAGDTVYINQGEEFPAVATADGTRRWELEIGARTGPPVIVGDTVFLHTNPSDDNDSQLLAIHGPQSRS